MYQRANDNRSRSQRYEQPPTALPTARQAVHQAWADWQAAINYFQNVSDPELVDYAIYEVEASRRKYIYMLKHAKEGGWDV